MQKLYIKSWIGIIFTFFILFSMPVWAGDYSDIQGHFAEEAIRTWSQRGIVQGYGGQFRPNADISRGELAVILNRILGYQASGQNLGKYSDVGNHFYSQDLLSLNEHGIIRGDRDRLRPRDSVTREEAAVMLSRAFRLKGQGHLASINDQAQISAWAREAIGLMSQKAFMNGYLGSIFPKKTLSRGELVQILDNMVAVYISQSGEYQELDLNPNQADKLIIIKANQVKLNKSIGNNPILITGDDDLQAVYLADSNLGHIQILDRKKPIMVLLEKTHLLGLQAGGQGLSIYSDQDSQIGNSNHLGQDLEAGKKAWANQKIDFGQRPNPGQSDHYQPVLPKDTTRDPKAPDRPPIFHPLPEVRFLAIMDGLKADGAIHKLPGQGVDLPDSLPIGLSHNGENTGQEILVVWTGQDLEKLKAGQKGRYLVQVQTQGQVIINDINYGKVIFPSLFIIE